MKKYDTVTCMSIFEQPPYSDPNRRRSRLARIFDGLLRVIGSQTVEDRRYPDRPVSQHPETFSDLDPDNQ